MFLKSIFATAFALPAPAQATSRRAVETPRRNRPGIAATRRVGDDAGGGA